MILQVLASGSKGNVTYIEEGGQSILIDAGLSCRETVRRMRVAGREPEKLRGIFITHDHRDHIAGARVLSRTFGIPVILSETLYAAAGHKWLKDVSRISLYPRGSNIHLESMFIRPVPVSHDATETVSVIVSNGQYAAGIFTDLGTVSLPVSTCAADVDLLMVEANHDLKMLKNGPYPLWLQQRIRSNQGHLSNDQCGELLVNSCRKGRVKKMILAHISEENNRYDLAYTSVNRYLNREKIDLPVYVAKQKNILGELGIGN
ncbi:MAG: MBL fold metallo-hydrolase [Candidatus Neomarinimicrobiota bacterium]|nr:MAG: MBL fold metallo-hydrolase [Candidatus Neomarinimicrobiota bacterium]